MPNLEKAKIYELSSGRRPRVIGDPTDVQFNPESLAIQLTNRIEGGRSTGRQVRQFIGSSSSTFSLDLEFDTADEGTTLNPISVLERTEILEKFLKPKKANGRRSREQPAKIRFHWGNLIIDGIVETIDLEFDHFAQNGVPLHAKAGVKIKQQKVEFQFNSDQEEPASQERSATAQSDELPADAAARLNKDPTDWRDLASNLTRGMTLDPGSELNYQMKKSASLGSGLKLGLNAGINTELAVSLGLSVGASVNIASHLSNDSRPKKQLASGLALTQAGGVDAANNQLAVGQSTEAAGSAFNAFNTNAESKSDQATGSNTAKSSQTNATSASTSIVSKGRATPRPSGRVQADSRATTFGFGVPLQNLRVPLLAQQNSLRASSKGRHLNLDRDWCFSDSGRKESDRIQADRRPLKRCGCQSKCKH